MTAITGGTDGHPDSGSSAEINTVAEFAAALTALRQQAGLSVRQVAAKTDLRAATLGGYFSGRHLPTVSQTDAFRKVLEALGVSQSGQREWLSALADLRQRRRVDASPTPFRGLESYRVEDSEWFVGREELTGQLEAQVLSLLDGASAPRAITVVGASGVGKSSVVAAGLLARLRHLGIDARSTVPDASLPEVLREFGSGADGPAVLVVDQVEEIFSADYGRQEREALIDQIDGLVHDSGVVLVLVLRADFFAAATAEAALRPLLSVHQFPVGPLGLDELRRVIEEPARKVGRSVEPDFTDLLLRDVSSRGVVEPSALPLLSHALLSTWQRSDSGGLAVANYLLTGGVAGAVQRTADQAYETLDPAGKAAARSLLWHLVSVDDTGFATRRRMRLAELPGGESRDAVIESLLSRRILTATDETVELSHEVLIEVWPRLREWIEDDREDLVLRRRVGSASDDWAHHDHDHGLLLRDPLLERAAGLAERKPTALTETEQEYVDLSLAHRSVENRSQRRRRVVLRGLVVVVALLAVVASGLSIVLSHSLDEARAQRAATARDRDASLSREIALQASEVRASDPALSRQLSLAAYQISPTLEARSSVIDSSTDPPATRLRGATAGSQVAVSPGGRLLVSAGGDGVLRVWHRKGADGRAPRLAGTVAVSEQGLTAAVFSPTSSELAVGDSAGVVSIVDLSDPAAPRVGQAHFVGPRKSINALAFSPEGAQLWATSDEKNGLFGWRLGGTDPVPLASATGLRAKLHGLAVGPGGRQIVTGGEDGRLRLWGVVSGRLVERQSRQAGTTTNLVGALAISPGGDLVAAAARDRRVRLWRIEGDTLRSLRAPLDGFPSYVNAVTFDRSGSRLAAAGSGDSIRVYDTRTWRLQASFGGDTDYSSVAFDPGSSDVVTGSADGFVRLWSPEQPRLEGLRGNVWSLAYTSSGNRLYVGVGLNRPKIVQVDVSQPASPRLERVISSPGPKLRLDGVIALSPDEDLLVAGTLEGRVIVWPLPEEDAAPGQPFVLPGGRELIETIAFSADGSHFATGADDGSVQVYRPRAARRPARVHSLSVGGEAYSVALDSDASTLAVGTGDDMVQLWDLSDRGGDPRALDPIDDFDNDVYTLSLSADDSLLAVGDTAKTVTLWDMTDPSEVRRVGDPLLGPGDTVWGLAFADDNSELAGSSADGRVWIWSLTGSRPTLVARLQALGTEAFPLVRRPGVEGYATGGSGVVTWWSTDVDRLQDEICSESGSTLDEREWKQYVADRDFQPPC